MCFCYENGKNFLKHHHIAFLVHVLSLLVCWFTALTKETCVLLLCDAYQRRQLRVVVMHLSSWIGLEGQHCIDYAFQKGIKNNEGALLVFGENRYSKCMLITKGRTITKEIKHFWKFDIYRFSIY